MMTKEQKQVGLMYNETALAMLEKGDNAGFDRIMAKWDEIVKGWEQSEKGQGDA